MNEHQLLELILDLLVWAFLYYLFVDPNQPPNQPSAEVEPALPFQPGLEETTPKTSAPPEETTLLTQPAPEPPTPLAESTLADSMPEKKGTDTKELATKIKNLTHAQLRQLAGKLKIPKHLSRQNIEQEIKELIDRDPNRVASALEEKRTK